MTGLVPQWLLSLTAFSAVFSVMLSLGLAMLVATLNRAPPAIGAVILSYVLVSALTVTPYVLWRRRAPG